jgi:hypothetical protein
MIHAALKNLLIAALVATIAATSRSPALACACCSYVAQRTVEVQKIDGRIAAQIELLRFQKAAKLVVDERYDDAIEGLEEAVEDFTVTVTKLKDRISFALRDEKGRTGTLSLVKPQAISIFEVDPRDTADTGAGPSLYKEWKITSAVAGDGIFRRSAGSNRRITLVLHGRGNSCTEVDDFKHWTLLVHGRGTQTYTFYGELAPSGQ